MPTLKDADELHELLRKVQNNEPVPPSDRTRCDDAGAEGRHQDRADEQAQTVARAVDGWQQHFAACGVRHADIDLYAEQIDRPYLREQRREFAGG